MKFVQFTKLNYPTDTLSIQSFNHASNHSQAYAPGNSENKKKERRRWKLYNSVRIPIHQHYIIRNENILMVVTYINLIATRYHNNI